MNLKELPARFAAFKAKLRKRSPALDVAFSTFEGFSAHDGGPYAAALTYYMFFSIFPMLLFAVAALGFVLANDPELKRDILDAGFQAFPMLEDLLLRDVLKQVEENRQEIASVGVVMALYSGSGGVAALEHALNVMLDVPREAEPKFLEKRLRAVRWIGAVGAAAVVSVILGTVTTFASDLFGLGSSSIVARTLLHAAGLVVGVLIFAMTYRYLPVKHQSWRTVLPGAVVAALAFEVLKEVGGWYLRRAAGGPATFGAFSTAAALLVACYLISQIVLLCAELNGVLARRAGTPEASATPT